MSTDILDPILDRVHRGHCWIKTENGPRRLDEPLTPHHIARHLSGKAAFGACPLAPGESTVRLALFDFDSHGGETSPEAMTEVVARVIGHCAQFSLQPIAFRSSGGNGIHLYFIWDEPQDAYSVRVMLRRILEASELKPGTGGVHKKEVEIFPKQSSVPSNGYGSMFILPLAGKSVRLKTENGLVEIPRRLSSRWDWPVSKPVPHVQAPDPKPRVAPSTTDFIELRSLLSAIPNQDTDNLDYDVWRNAIFAIHHATEGSDEGLALAHEFSARSPKYDPAFLDERVWPYITDNQENPVTLASLRYIARQYEDPADDFEDLGPLPDPEPDTPVVPGQTTQARFHVYGEDEILQRPRPTWIVKNVIPDAALVVIYGQPSSGKSFLALDLFACVAQGVPWRGIKTQMRRVIYLAAEGQGGFRNRLEAYRQHHEHSSGLRMILDAPNFLKSDADLVSAQILAAGGADIIVIDTLAQVTPGGDENSAEDMGRALLSCRRLRSKTGALIVLIHHSGKDATKGARGWSGLKGAADAELEINRLESQRWVKVSKSKEGEDGTEYPFQLIPVTLGQDEDGEGITSCVIGHMERRAVTTNNEPKGKVERVVWRQAHDLVGVGCAEVSVDTLIAAAAKQLPHDSTSGRDRRREFARKAITTLVDGGFLLLEDNLITVPGFENDAEDLAS